METRVLTAKDVTAEAFKPFGEVRVKLMMGQLRGKYLGGDGGGRHGALWCCRFEAGSHPRNSAVRNHSSLCCFDWRIRFYMIRVKGRDSLTFDQITFHDKVRNLDSYLDSKMG